MQWKTLAVMSAVLLGLVLGGQSPAQQDKGEKPEAKQAKKDTAQDPVCEMNVKKELAKTYEYEKKVGDKTFKTTLYFCSDKCLNKFKADPSKYPTGMPGDVCMCKKEMPDCDCGHCSGKNEKCDCGEENEKEK